MEMEREQIVWRHNPEFDRLDPLSPLSVGNGEFAFTADITGLQTFPEQYEVPLGTQSNWGWHFTGARQVLREGCSVAVVRDPRPAGRLSDEAGG